MHYNIILMLNDQNITIKLFKINILNGRDWIFIKKTYEVLLKKYKLKYLKYSKNITLFIDPLGTLLIFIIKKALKVLDMVRTQKRKSQKYLLYVTKMKMYIH